MISQAIYAVIGIALMLTLARIDYSRFRELRVGPLHGDDLAASSWCSSLGEATRGSRRWIELPFFTFQPSELGKLMLIVTLAAFALERARHGSEAQAHGEAAGMLGLVPG